MARHTGFYLNKRNGRIMGVCAGIADYTGFDVTWIRVGMLAGALFGGGFLFVIYLLIGWIASDKPGALYTSEADPEDRAFWQKTRAKPGRTVREVRSRFRDIDRRLRDIELSYTSQSSQLAREIDSLKNQ